MSYLSLFTLSGSLLALLVCGKLLVQKRVNSDSGPLFCIVIFLSIRAYRDFQVFLPQIAKSELAGWIYHLSETTLLLPYLLYLWVCRRSGENKAFKWGALWPYGYQFLLATTYLWYDPFFGEITSMGVRVLMLTRDAILIILIFFFAGRVVERKSTLGKPELWVVYSLLIGLGVQSINNAVRFILNGLHWQEVFISYMIVKSSVILVITYVLHQLYGGTLAKGMTRLKSNTVTANPDLVEAFLEKKMHLNHEITVLSAAKELGVPKIVLSKTIAELGVKNFVEFVNEHRLNHFLELVEERVYLKLSIMGMAESSGFKSKATFNRVFKARMGITPSDYINQQGLGDKSMAAL